MLTIFVMHSVIHSLNCSPAQSSTQTLKLTHLNKSLILLLTHSSVQAHRMNSGWSVFVTFCSNAPININFMSTLFPFTYIVICLKGEINPWKTPSMTAYKVSNWVIPPKNLPERPEQIVSTRKRHHFSAVFSIHTRLIWNGLFPNSRLIFPPGQGCVSWNPHSDPSLVWTRPPGRKSGRRCRSDWLGWRGISDCPYWSFLGPAPLC